MKATDFSQKDLKRVDLDPWNVPGLVCCICEQKKWKSTWARSESGQNICWDCAARVPNEKASAEIDLAGVYSFWQGIKYQFTEGVLLLGIGEKYLTFGADAEKAARVLGISILEKEGQKVCEFERIYFEIYLQLLVRAGHRVAVADNAGK